MLSTQVHSADSPHHKHQQEIRSLFFLLEISISLEHSNLDLQMSRSRLQQVFWMLMLSLLLVPEVPERLVQLLDLKLFLTDLRFCVVVQIMKY